MTIHPFTVQEWEDLLHVILTADTDWDPTIIDCKLEDGEEWYDAMQDLLEQDLDFPFDDVGDYKHVDQVANALAENNLIDKHVIMDYNDALMLYNQNIMPSKIDFESYQSKLAWLPANVIKNMFEQTT